MGANFTDRQREFYRLCIAAVLRHRDEITQCLADDD